VIYAYIPSKNIIYLIEIYSKNDKKNEDRKRIINKFVDLFDLAKT